MSSGGGSRRMRASSVRGWGMGQGTGALGGGASVCKGPGAGQ